MSVHALQLKHERWKYTDLSVFDKHVFVECAQTDELNADLISSLRLKQSAVLLVLVNGRLNLALSDLAKLPAGVIACSLLSARNQHANLLTPQQKLAVNPAEYPYAAMNLETERDGLFLHVPANKHVDIPFHILCITHGQACVQTNTQHVFVFGAGSRATVLQEYVSDSTLSHFNNAVTTIAAAKQSVIHWVKHQHENTAAIHMENYFVQQQQDSTVEMTHMTLGAQFSRDDIRAELNASGAVCRTSGFYHTKRDGQYVDHHIDILHQHQNTQSDMLYKGIVDKKSRAVFNGKLQVEKQAQKTNAVQGNHHILLSPFAEAYSKPELEIYADDVKCKHGATTGQLDEDALFYLRSRGISREGAVSILLQGFCDEVLQRIAHQGIKEHIKQQVHFDEK